MPTDGESCTGTIGPCTYGDHTLIQCRTSAGCGNGKWTVTPPPAACTQLEPACLTNSCGLNVTCENGAWKWEYKDDPLCKRVCASPDTPIATPLGERPIAELRPGDVVYSVDHDAIVAVPLTRVRRAYRANESDSLQVRLDVRHPACFGHRSILRCRGAHGEHAEIGNRAEASAMSSRGRSA
jgi:hypothetical protein